LVRHRCKMNRFFVKPNQVDDHVIRIVRKDDLHHIKTVLRLKQGDQIEISDGEEWEYEGVIGVQDGEGLKVDVVKRQHFAREPKVHITLYQGIPKMGKMDFIIQKAVELGVSEIVPVFMARTVVADKGNFGKKLARYEMIAEEAASQCGRGIVPFIRHAIPFNKIPDSLDPDTTVLFLYENEKNVSIKDVLRGLPKIPQRVALLVGPEGGFAPEEAEALRNLGIESVTLGKTILRTETAGLAALAMCMYELEM